MIERLDMDDNYSEYEIAIHYNRYYISKNYCDGKKVLDIACGEGYGSYLISNWGADEVIGIDISEEAIDKANKNFKNDNLKYLVQDATNLEALKDNYFDLIVSYETFEHVPNVEKYLKEIKRVAKKDAVIIISCPNDYYYYPTEEEHNPFHMKKYTFEDYKKTAEKYLGKNVQYMLGMEVMGYINTLLDSNFSKDKKNRDIIDSSYELDCQRIYNESKVSPTVCNYYIGIWNTNLLKENCTVFPHMYTDWKQVIDEMNKDNDILREYNKELENNKSELLEKIFVLDREDKKNKQINSIIMYQKEEVSKYANGLNQEINNLNQEISNLRDDYKKLELEIDNLNKTIDDLIDKNETLKWQNDFITNSRSYKLTRKIVKLVKRK